MIQVQNIAKSFGPVRAVQDVSFVAPDGAITGLLGANGAGKTTTLRMICGVLQPDAGMIQTEGDLRASTGGLLDHAGLYQRLTVRENLAYFGQLRGMEGERLRHRIDDLVELLGLQSIADRRTAGFSQGERSKTAIARAMIHSPRNLVLDEPANGLDIPSVRLLRALLGRLRDAGMCIILSSHLLEEVRTMCDQAVVISKGCVAAQGSPEELCVKTGKGNLEDAFVDLAGVEA